MKEENIYILYNDIKGERVLEYAPESWDDTGIIIGRDTVFHGINTEVSVDVRFVKDGKAYIDRVYEEQGIDAVIEFTWLVLNKRKNDYELFHSGRIKLDSWKGEDVYTSVGIEALNFFSKLKNRYETPINSKKLTSISGSTISAFSTENENVLTNLHSKSILKQFIGRNNPDYDEIQQNLMIDITEAGIGNKTVENIRYITLGFAEEVSEITGVNGSITTGMSTTYPVYILKTEEPGEHSFKVKSSYFFKIKGDNLGPIDIKLDSCSAGNGYYDNIRIDLIFRIVNTSVEKELLNIATYEDNGCGLFELVVSDAVDYILTRNLIVDDEVYVYFKMRSYSVINKNLISPRILSSTYDATINKNSTLQVNAITTSAFGSSYASGLFIHEAWVRNLQAITDEANPFYSELYGKTTSSPTPYSVDGEYCNRVIMNGFGIRGFSTNENEKPIFLTLKDLFETCDAIDNIGLGIENGKVRVEKKSYFYRPEITVFLQNVFEVTVIIAKEYYYNGFEFGYEKWENEEVNNLDEFNSNRNYTTPIQTVNNKLVKKSPYIASGYTIEFTRRNRFTATSTKDWKYDNDNFIIQVKEATEEAFLHPWQAEKAEDFDISQFENLLDPATSYNLKLAPRRSLEKWGYVLNGSLKYYQSDYLKFAFGGANYKMRDKLTVDTAQIGENDNVLISTLEAPIWIPEYYEFQYPVFPDTLRTIRENPYGLIKFSSKNVNYYAYIVSIKIDPVKNLGEFKLLRANYTE